MSDGKVYNGEFKENKFEGIGELKWPGGNMVYMGSFRAGIRHGAGIMTYPGGKMFEGTWVDGKEEGEGTLITRGRRIEGVWKEGVIVSTKDPNIKIDSFKSLIK